MRFDLSQFLYMVTIFSPQSWPVMDVPMQVFTGLITPNIGGYAATTIVFFKHHGDKPDRFEKISIQLFCIGVRGKRVNVCFRDNDDMFFPKGIGVMKSHDLICFKNDIHFYFTGNYLLTIEV